MTLLEKVRLLAGAAFAGLVIGVAFSGDDLVSVQAWVGATAVTIVAVMIRDLVVAASIETPTVSPAWTLPALEKGIAGPRGTQNIRAVLSSTQASPRTFERKLRPQLVTLAEHYIPRRHGLDLSEDNSQVAAILGDVSWLIDPTVNDRIPTRDELERFVDVVVGDEESQALDGRRPRSVGT